MGVRLLCARARVRARVRASARGDIISESEEGGSVT